MFSRDSWDARTPKRTTFIASAKGVKGHYTGGFVTTRVVTDHEECNRLIREIQNFHMDIRGWNDIAYSMIACDHGFSVGRGAHVLTAANGPGLNMDHYSILLLRGNSGAKKLTDALKFNFHEARKYLMTFGDAGKEIKGHRDGYSTDCPGPDIYPWIHAGAPINGITIPPVGEEDKRMLEYAAFRFTGEADIPVGKWVSVPWDVEDADPTKIHDANGMSVLKGDPCVYAGVEFTFDLEGVSAGTSVYTRVVECTYDATVTPPVDRIVETGLVSSHIHTPGNQIHHVASGKLQEGRKLQFQVFVDSSVGTATEPVLTNAAVHAPFSR